MKLFTIFILYFLITGNAYAYIGIGPLLPLLGSAILYIFLGLVSVLGFIIYPIRKIYKYFKDKKKVKFEKNKK